MEKNYPVVLQESSDVSLDIQKEDDRLSVNICYKDQQIRLPISAFYQIQHYIDIISYGSIVQEMWAKEFDEDHPLSVEKEMEFADTMLQFIERYGSEYEEDHLYSLLDRYDDELREEEAEVIC